MNAMQANSIVFRFVTRYEERQTAAVSAETRITKSVS